MAPWSQVKHSATELPQNYLEMSACYPLINIVDNPILMYLSV